MDSLCSCYTVHKQHTQQIKNLSTKWGKIKTEKLKIHRFIYGSPLVLTFRVHGVSQYSKHTLTTTTVQGHLHNRHTGSKKQNLCVRHRNSPFQLSEKPLKAAFGVIGEESQSFCSSVCVLILT